MKVVERMYRQLSSTFLSFIIYTMSSVFSPALLVSDNANFHYILDHSVVFLVLDLFSQNNVLAYRLLQKTCNLLLVRQIPERKKNTKLLKSIA